MQLIASSHPLRVSRWFAAFMLVAFVFQILVFASNYLPTAADNFFWPYFFHDLASGAMHYENWTLPPSGYLFPDAPLYGLLWVLTGGSYVGALLLQFLVTGLLFVFGCQRLFKELTRWTEEDSWLVALSVGLIVGNPFLMPDGILIGLAAPASHAGAWVLFVWGFYLLALHWKTPDARFLWLLGVLSAVGSLGDPLFALSFSGGVCLVGVLYRRWGICLVTVLSTLGGLAFASWIKPNAEVLYASDGTWYSIKVLQNQALLGFPGFSRDISEMLACKPVLVLAVASSLVVGGMLPWKHRCGLLWWAVLLAWGAFSPWVFSMALRIYDGSNHFRHFFFIVPLGLSLLFMFLGPRVRVGVGLLAMVAALFSSLSVGPKNCFYPSIVSDLDFIKTRLCLKDGLASYWYCKQTNLLSRAGTFLAPLTKTAELNPALGTLDDFRGRDFNYILCNILFTKDILKRFGEPKTVFDIDSPRLGNRWVIFVYPEGALNRVIAADPLPVRIMASRGR